MLRLRPADHAGSIDHAQFHLGRLRVAIAAGVLVIEGGHDIDTNLATGHYQRDQAIGVELRLDGVSKGLLDKGAEVGAQLIKHGNVVAIGREAFETVDEQFAQGTQIFVQIRFGHDADGGVFAFKFDLIAVKVVPGGRLGQGLP